MKKIKSLLLLSSSIILSACGAVSSYASIESNGTDDSNVEISSSKELSRIPEAFLNTDYGSIEEMSELSSFAPTLFDQSSVQIEKTDELGDGVKHHLYSFKLSGTKTNGRRVEAHVVEVDTTKARIRTEKSSSPTTVNAQINKFESKNDSKVMAAINADFFNPSNGVTVNAYVKDSLIVKASHNATKGSYDYTVLDNDIPASMPMLFGVSGSHSRIAPIVENKTVEETINSKFFYKTFYGKEYEDISNLPNTLVNAETMDTNDFAFIVDGETTYSAAAGETYYKIKKDKEHNSCFVFGQVESVKVLETTKKYTSSFYMDDYLYLFQNASSTSNKLEVGDYVGYCIGNDDDIWNGYTDIIGGRQSLVENGEIAPTVTLENSNGAQSTNIPRTCAGIKPDGTVLITAIESLRYGDISKSADDPYGVNLPELAEFMRFIGCYDALNFDGGGSTTLITADNNGLGNKTMQLRSSDYGTYNVDDGRKVANTLLVTTK